MNPELLAAYHYLSSAIAQAFAALIALTAIFYFHRINTIRNRTKEIANTARAVLVYCKAQTEASDKKSFDGKGVVLSAYYNLLPDETVISRLKEAPEKFTSLDKEDTLMLSENAAQIPERFQKMKALAITLSMLIVIPIILSALAMAVGIAALLFGWWFWDLSLGLVWGIMIGESYLAASALSWTVFVVIKMLKEPEKPQTEAEPSPQPSPKGRG